MPRARADFEALESRTLMSVTPFNAAVKLDRAHIRLDFLKFNADLYADAAKLRTDNKALRKDDLKDNTTLQPLVAKLRADIANFQLTLKADRLTEASNVISDQLIIVADLKQKLADKGNATALAADHTKLMTDRATVQTDMVAGITQRLTDRQAETTLLSMDSQDILTELPTSNASAKLTADVSLWLGDKGASVAKITADLAKVSAGRTQLIADLTAEQQT